MLKIVSNKEDRQRSNARLIAVQIVTRYETQCSRSGMSNVNGATILNDVALMLGIALSDKFEHMISEELVQLCIQKEAPLMSGNVDKKKKGFDVKFMILLYQWLPHPEHPNLKCHEYFKHIFLTRVREAQEKEDDQSMKFFGKRIMEQDGWEDYGKKKYKERSFFYTNSIIGAIYFILEGYPDNPTDAQTLEMRDRVREILSCGKVNIIRRDEIIEFLTQHLPREKAEAFYKKILDPHTDCPSLTDRRSSKTTKEGASLIPKSEKTEEIPKSSSQISQNIISYKNINFDKDNQ